MFEVEGIQYSESELPEQFHELIPLLTTWCIGDDALRSEKLSDASTEELLAVVNRVEPRLADIDEFLSSFGDTPSEAACLLGKLAECTAAAQMELGLREATQELPE